MSEQGTHPAFQIKGISKNTCDTLGIGFLASGRSQLKNSIVFQIRGVEVTNHSLSPVILSHIGWNPEKTSTTPWIRYEHFDPSLELYNLDQLLLNPEAKDQTEHTRGVLLVPSPWDVTKCWEADIYNVVATFGTSLTAEQISHIELIQSRLEPENYLVWDHRSLDGDRNQNDARESLRHHGFSDEGFDWEQSFTIPKTQKPIFIPEEIGSPCDMTVEQLQWLRKQGLI